MVAPRPRPARMRAAITPIASRRAPLSKVDPGGARLLFIQRALVEREWESPHAFLARNAERVEEVLCRVGLELRVLVEEQRAHRDPAVDMRARKRQQQRGDCRQGKPRESAAQIRLVSWIHLVDGGDRLLAAIGLKPQPM